MFFLSQLDIKYRVSPMATYFYSQARPNGLLPKGNIQNLKVLSLLVQSKEGKRNTPPVSVLFFTFANFYGQFVNLPLRGFEHDKLTLKSSRKRSGTEDWELKTKRRVLRFLLPHFSH